MGVLSFYTMERMNSCLNGAKDAADQALSCDAAHLRDAYLDLANDWMELASKIERRLPTNAN